MVVQEEKRESIKVLLKRTWSGHWASTDTSPPQPTLTSHSVFEPPQTKIPRRIAHVPNQSPLHSRPLTPSSKSPSAERSPFNSIGHSPPYPLDNLLTPTSNCSPNAEIEKIDPVDQLISTIINWNAGKIIDGQYKERPFHTNLVSVPPHSFETLDYYQKYVELSIHYTILLLVTNNSSVDADATI